MTPTCTPPALDVCPLSEMEEGDLSELSCAPVLGVKVTDYDCCSTESWVVVGPALGDDATLLVESIEATQHHYWGPVVWQVIDTLSTPTLADAIAATLELAHYGGLGRRRCRCDGP